MSKLRSLVQREAGQKARIFFLLFCLLSHAKALAQELALDSLVREAIERSPEILSARARALAAHHKVPQARSLPDPMFMTGYQNEGWKKYTYGEMPDAQWMFSASQMIPFPGKLDLKGRTAQKEAQALEANVEQIKLQVILRVKELFYELFLAHKTLEILSQVRSLFQRVEEAALARYGAGKAGQQEVLMAQTERYMLLEKEEMQKQKIVSLEAMLNAAVGRPSQSPLGTPRVPDPKPLSMGVEDLLRMAYERSPQLKAKEKMIEAAQFKVSMAQKEFFPDLTLSASYFTRGGGQFEDMWSLTATVNVPIFFATKQKEGVEEARASLAEAHHELGATKLMIEAAVRENFSMVQAADNLMALYRGAIIPKNYQDFELALSGYIVGRIEAITLISRLKAFLETELLYWVQFTQREKAIAKLETLAGGWE